MGFGVEGGTDDEVVLAGTADVLDGAVEELDVGALDTTSAGRAAALSVGDEHPATATATASPHTTAKIFFTLCPPGIRVVPSPFKMRRISP